MISRVNTICFQGVEAIDVDVQVSVTPTRKSYINIVGLPGKAVGESKERIQSAFRALGLTMPQGKVLINLSPADLNKEGNHFDLPIAMGILDSIGILDKGLLSKYIICGELSLDGSISKVSGILPASIHASANSKSIICPYANGHEASWAGEEIEIIAAKDLLSIINHLKGTQILSRPEALKKTNPQSYTDFSDIKGQKTAKRALEIAAAGGHNVLMKGPPGSGKSMLASAMPSILPTLDNQEILEVSMIASITGNLDKEGLSAQRPFRNPHHSCSEIAMVGGGRNAKPGEISLAHNGVLFLDELPEFPRPVLESLRQPIETGKITISRAEAHITYPAKFQLIAAMNPCRCGFLGEEARHCHKAPRCGNDYQSKISGPLLDRMDIQIEVPPISYKELQQEKNIQDSAQIAKKVTSTYQLQKQRYARHPISSNSQASGRLLIEHASPDEQGKQLIDKAFEQMGLSMRGYNRILRVARTIADLENEQQVTKHHIAEALSYRGFNFIH